MPIYNLAPLDPTLAHIQFRLRRENTLFLHNVDFAGLTWSGKQPREQPVLKMERSVHVEGFQVPCCEKERGAFSSAGEFWKGVVDSKSLINWAHKDRETVEGMGSRKSLRETSCSWTHLLLAVQTSFHCFSHSYPPHPN